MRDVFSSMDALLKSDFYKNLQNCPTAEKTDRVLKSLRIEDEIYKDARAGVGDILNDIEDAGHEKLASFESLSRDVFQSFYTLQIKRNPEESLTPIAQKINRGIIEDAMLEDDYPAIKSICEGREFPAMEAAVEFMTRISERLDDLLDAANGENRMLDTLEKQEKQQKQRLDELRQSCALHADEPAPALEKKILRMANTAQSKESQIAAMSAIVSDNLLKNKKFVDAVVSDATQAAFAKADQVRSVIQSWGNDPADFRCMEENRELIDKVRSNPSLADIAKYLGRFRELFHQKRKNAFAYGRGEKYTLELGNNLQRLISSEYAMLATPQTAPLFVQKYQRKALKQYKRRDRICKAKGDIICCLDESSSTKGDNAAWGKAVALALLEIAKTNQRSFALVHFSSTGSFKTDLFIHGQYTTEDAMRAAQLFLGGGTNFETPMREAIRLIEEQTYSNADIVFITDGECEMPERFVEELRVKQATMRFTVTGILLDQGSSDMEFSLTPFCNDVYRISELGGDGIVNAILSDRAA